MRRALDSLPREIAAGSKNVAVVVEDENPDDPDILGLFSEEPYHAGADHDLPATARGVVP